MLRVIAARCSKLLFLCRRSQPIDEHLCILLLLIWARATRAIIYISDFGVPIVVESNGQLQG